METKINIAEILKDKPQGTKLYSRICGAVELKKVIDARKKKSIVVKELNSNNQHRFWHDGNFFRAGQCVLQPSENMADWSKYAWKKGDILVSNDGGREVIFDKWYDETYTSFYCKHYLNSEDENKIVYYEAFLCTTESYSLEDKDAAQTYINTIEKRLGGKLNLETLEIEKPTEFKDGDIAFADFGNTQDVFIVSGKTNLSEGYYSFIALNLNSTKALNIGYKKSFFKENLSTIRLATEEEKQQLFDALAKEGKAWDAGKKEVVDLKPKVKLKPFDKVLCRNSKDDTWEADFFARLTRKEIDYTQSGKYLCVGDLWMYCIPYNEETAHLLGTTDDWKGGEG